MDDNICEDAEPSSPHGSPALIGWVQKWAVARCVPLNVNLEITQRCNLRCRHCYNFDRDEPRSGCGEEAPELSTPEILELITELHRAGCLFLALTGGEALVHPDLFAFLDRARQLNMAVRLLTNGVLLRPGMARALAAYPNLFGVSISFYGGSAETHDAITQAPGSFERTWKGAQLLRDKGIEVRVKFPVMRQNAHEVEAMLAAAQARGFTCSVDTTITARHDGTRTSLDMRVTESQLEGLYRGPLRSLLARGPNRVMTAEQFACNCARNICAVSAQGDVLPCISVPWVAGNIRQTPFGDIWRDSPVFRRIRGLRVEDYPQCAPCPHKSWCTRERGAAYTYSGSYTGTDPLVCARAVLAHKISDEEARDGTGTS